MLQLDLRDRPVFPEGIYVDLEGLVVVGQAISVLADAAEGGVRIHDQIQILVLGDPALKLDALIFAHSALSGLVVDIVALTASLAHPDFFHLVHFEIGLDDLDLLAVGKRIQHLDIRILDEEFALDLEGTGLTEEGRDLRDQALHLVLKVRRVVDDTQVGMPRPGCNELVIHGCRLFYGLYPGGIIGRGIEFFGAFGRGDQMEYGVILIPKLHFAGMDRLKDRLEGLLIHIDFVVQRRPVTDDQDLVLFHDTRCLLKDLLLLQLKAHVAVLVVRIGPAGPRRNTAGDELRGGLRHEQHVVPSLGEGILDPVHGRCLARAGTSCNDNFCYVHTALLQQFHTI